MTLEALIQLTNMLQHAARQLRRAGMADAALDIEDISFEVWEQFTERAKPVAAEVVS